MRDTISYGWEMLLNKKEIKNDIEVCKAVETAINELDSGVARISEKKDGKWVVDIQMKQAILMYFNIRDCEITNITASASSFPWYDKVPLKTESWTAEDFKNAKFRLLPGAMVRKGSFVDKNAIIMPSFTNIGAYIGKNTMIDTYAHVGSCAQIGNNCHLSMYAGLGGVLEPQNANPVIIEDNCFIGSHSCIVDGVIVEEGSVIATGVHITSSTKIVDRETGEFIYGRVPAGSVVVSGSIQTTKNEFNIKTGEVCEKEKKQSISKHTNISTYAAIIVKKVDTKTKTKTELNELLRQ